MESEEIPDRILLETKISKDDGYQKQQGNLHERSKQTLGANSRIDTLIVWTEANGTDMALSFQEADGCAAIWYVVGPTSI